MWTWLANRVRRTKNGFSNGAMAKKHLARLEAQQVEIDRLSRALTEGQFTLTFERALRGEPDR